MIVGASQEGKRFFEILGKSEKLVDSHYENPLPLKRENIQLSNNKLQAEKILASLRKKMAKNYKSKDNYMRFMRV